MNVIPTTLASMIIGVTMILESVKELGAISPTIAWVIVDGESWSASMVFAYQLIKLLDQLVMMSTLACFPTDSLATNTNNVKVTTAPTKANSLVVKVNIATWVLTAGSSRDQDKYANSIMNAYQTYTLVILAPTSAVSVSAQNIGIVETTRCAS